VREKQHERQIMPAKPLGASYARVNLFPPIKRGLTRRDEPRGGISGSKKAAGFKEPCGFY
jgi:hypothetical protein